MDRPLKIEIHPKLLIFDLDGVLTTTRKLHVASWDGMFSEFLEYLRKENTADKSKADLSDFDPIKDYDEYVDGKPRYEGIQSFLEARSIELPYGTPDDDPSELTICGLGNRKNKVFNQMLEEQPPGFFKDATQALQKWKEEGYKLAVGSSSRNATKILKKIDWYDFFDTIVDGNDIANIPLSGKPNPDMFLEANRRLGVSSKDSVLFEDSQAGIQAGVSGEYGAVIWVNRRSAEPIELLEEESVFEISMLTQLEFGGSNG